MTPDELERVFHPFFSTKSQGTRLGLAISRSIAEGHGGQLWVVRREPYGAIFRLVLPAERGLP